MLIARFQRLWNRRFQILTTLFHGGFVALSIWILIVQGLAFFKVFRVSISLLLFCLVFPLYMRLYLHRLPTWPEADRNLPWPVALVLFMVGAGLWGLTLAPFWLWPKAYFPQQLVVIWDVVYYHLPKAVDLLQKGHMWNLAFPYGQYPIGWEALLALFLSLEHSALGLGKVYGVMMLWWAFAFGYLLTRETRWPAAVTFFLTSALMGTFLLGWYSTPWTALSRSITASPGKNDLLAAALVLWGLLHLSWEPLRLSEPGFYLAWAAAWAVKPPAGLALGAPWMLWFWQNLRSNRKTAFLDGVKAGLAVGLGTLWVVRNLALMGRPMSPVAEVLAQRAVFWAALRPQFWALSQRQFLFVSLITLGTAIWALKSAPWRPYAWITFWLYLVFLFTPGGTVRSGVIQWRLGLPLLSWLWVLVGKIFARGIAFRPLFRPLAGLLLGAGVLLCALALPQAWRQLVFEPRFASLIEHPFLDSPGGPLYSDVFDYIDKQVRHARILAEVPFYYVYDPEWTNEPVRPGQFPAGMPRVVPQPQPTHMLFCAVVWHRPGYFKSVSPESVQETAQAWLRKGYELLYQDRACVLAKITP